MSMNFVNPYSGKEEETCSVSFAAQQQMGAHTTGSAQTEAEYNQSKMLGEWGVIKAKLVAQEFPEGTKLITYENTTNGKRGFFYTKKGNLWQRSYGSDGKPYDAISTPGAPELFIKSKYFKTSIPQSAASKADANLGIAAKVAADEKKYEQDYAISPEYAAASKKYGPGDVKLLKNGQPVVWANLDDFGLLTPGKDFVLHGAIKKAYTSDGTHVTVKATHLTHKVKNSVQLVHDDGSFAGQQHGSTAKWWIELIPDDNGKTALTPEPKVVAKSTPEPKFIGAAKLKDLQDSNHEVDEVIAVKGDEQIVFFQTPSGAGKFVHQKKAAGSEELVTVGVNSNIEKFVKPDDGWQEPDSKTTYKPLPKDETKPLAAPTPSSAVNAGSDSVGSMSHEDVAAMFVKIKDDLAKEQGLNIKGANPELDQVVYKAIGEKTGYTSAEVKAKIDAYKADGNKLSALKKKVMSGSKKVPEGKAQPTKATPAAPLNTDHHTNKPAQDVQPNGVPTTATPKLADEVKAAVQQEVQAAPAKHYSDEDVAAAYIISKDAIVANNNKGWTLYTKNDEFDASIAFSVQGKTGLTPLQQKQAIANYLGSGKKLSSLKKQLAKQGAFQPKADTLKKTGAAKSQEDKAKEVNDKSDAGYTPTPEVAKGTVPTDTGKPAPERVKREANESGDISQFSDAKKLEIFNSFKFQGAATYLTSPSSSNYDAFFKVQTQRLALKENYTLLQLVRIVDEQGAKKAGVENGHLFEKKVTTWLTTPEGTRHVKNKEQEKAKLLEQAKKKAEAEKLAKELEGNQPPLPADSALFQEMTPRKALGFQEQMLAAKPFGPGEKTGLRHYTGGAYVAMNGYLRGLNRNISDTDKRHIEPAIRGFRPGPEPMLLRRGTGARQFESLGVRNGDTSLLWGLTGKTFEDKGFLSTSAAGRAAFGGEVALEIEAPAGTPMMWVDNFSKHPGENEMLLRPGLKYKILNVRKEGSTFVVRMRIVDWPGKEG